MQMTHRLLLAAILLVLPASRGSAQTPQLADVLARVGAYITTFGDALSRVVAEERYVQTWRRPSVLPGTRGDYTSTRELQSDLMLVKPSPSAAWLPYRDVFAVDGLAVRDRAERLSQLFLEASATRDQQVARIQAESARLNLGDIDRTFNTPLFALQFLDARHQHRFAFTRVRERTSAPAAPADGSAAFRVSTEVWVVSFEEVARPTIIHTLDGRDVPVRGRFWLEPDSGRVLMSEFTVRERNRHGTLTVSYQSEPYLGLLVPIEMREHYVDTKAKSVIDGSASYGSFKSLDAEPRDAQPTIPPDPQ